MTRIKLVVSGLCAIVAISAIVASAASAELPELGRCVKATGETVGNKTVYHGKYNSKNCIGKSATEKGKYEFLPGPGPENKFYGVAVEPEPLLETTGGQKVSCASLAFKGEYTGPKTEKETIFFSGCSDAAGRPCQTTAAKAGEFESEALVGELGVIKAAKPKPAVGWDVKREGGGTIATYYCGTLPENLEMLSGSVIGTVKGGGFSNLNKMNKESIVSYAQTAGHQLPEMFEGQPKDTLSTTTTGVEKRPVEQTGLQGLDEVTSGPGESSENPENQEELEIKAK